MTLKTLITVNIAFGQKAVDWSAVRLTCKEYGRKAEHNLVIGRINKDGIKINFSAF